MENKVPENRQVLKVPKIQCHGDNAELAVRVMGPRG